MEPIIGDAATPAPDVVKDSDTARFADDVLRASREVPVIVDFWAPWCGPCRQLGPMIEKTVRAARGAVRLVKINIDENPHLAQQLRIQSIPAVYAFRDGQPVDGFVGALPESQVRAFVERLAGEVGPSPVEAAVAHASDLLDQGESATAIRIFDEILEEEPGHPAAIGGLVRAYVAGGDLDKARQALARAAPEQQDHPDVAGARAALALAEQAGDVGEVGDLRAAVAADPADHQARYDLALALARAGDREGAVSELLEIVRRNRAWNDDAARKQLLQFFEAFGPTDEVTVAGRRQLSAILFS